jgi:Uma2 family endonuclease
MTATTNLAIDARFPDSDGKPMADNTEQFSWIVLIKENLEILFADRADVFVAGDLLWYPIKSRLASPVAPDAMVAFGRPKGRRGSYKQWEENNVAPQVVFEILSPSNTAEEMEEKRAWYEKYGVEEYYQFDPESSGLDQLQGWQRSGNQLVEIPQMNGWVSPRLDIRFDLSQGQLLIYRPDGDLFLSSIELRRRVDTERECANAERERAETERERADKLAAYLKSIGVDPEQI